MTNILLSTLPRDLPVPIRRAMLGVLFRATAAAFECPVPTLSRRSYAECLRTFALFTTEQAARARLSGCDVRALKARLYRNAQRLGKVVRRWSGASTLDEVMALGQILYRAIGVDLQGNARGEITVRRCYFAQFYTAPVCDIISGLDHGLFSGLSGGRRLAFTERLTEGGASCRARLT